MLKTDDNWIAKSMEDKLIEATPQQSLFDLIMDNPDVVVFTCQKDAQHIPDTYIAEDPLKEAIRYFMDNKRPVIVITEKTCSIIKNGADCMCALRLNSVIRKVE